MNFTQIDGRLNRANLDLTKIYYMYLFPTKKNLVDDYTKTLNASVLCFKEHRLGLHCYSCPIKDCYLWNKAKNGKIKRVNFMSMFEKTMDNLPLDGKWYFYTCPGHADTEVNNNPANDLIRMYLKGNNGKDNLFFDNNVNLLRTKLVEINQLVDTNKRRSYEDELDSLSVKASFVKGKQIILLDDITTQGISMSATRDFLLKNGAEKVIMLAVSKTQTGEDNLI